MKFNLKNRPIVVKAWKKKYPIEKFDEWFEGFERELREMLDAGLESQDSHFISAIATIREILGE